MLKKDKALCLRTVYYSETSQVVTLFTAQTGKLSAIAKGSRRPKSAFGGAIEVFSLGDIVYAPPRGGKLATLTEFEQKNLFMGLRKKLFCLNSALFAAELLSEFTQDNDPHKDLFETVIQFLTDTANAQNDLTILGLLILFQLTLLNEVGTKPVLNQCANCNTAYIQNWPQTFFSSSANGMICPDCDQAFVDKVRLSKQSAAALNDLKLIAQTDQKTLNQVEKVLIYHFTELIGKPPKRAKYFLKG